MRPTIFACLLFLALTASSQYDKECRLFVERFVNAQKRHDLSAVGVLLVDSPDFLWITKGNAVWGKENALKRFENLYKGTWNLEPQLSELRIIRLEGKTNEVFVPIVFTIGEPGQEAKRTRFLMNMVLVKTGGRLRAKSILPIASLNQL